MTIQRFAPFTLALLCMIAPVFGQWINYPTRGILRLSDRRPNLSAPTPYAAGHHPDLSGIWQLYPAPYTVDSIQDRGGDYRGGPEFGDIGARLAGGLAYQPWAAEFVKNQTRDLGKNDPVAWCKPSGALRLLTYPPYRKIIQTPVVNVLLSERDVTHRQIFTDGRPLPKDPSPSWNGYAVGQWQGDPLVVESVGFRDGTWLDRRVA